MNALIDPYSFKSIICTNFKILEPLQIKSCEMNISYCTSYYRTGIITNQKQTRKEYRAYVY